MSELKVHTPKGFGRNYFSLAVIQAYISLKKIMALSSSVCTPVYFNKLIITK